MSWNNPSDFHNVLKNRIEYARRITYVYNSILYKKGGLFLIVKNIVNIVGRNMYTDKTITTKSKTYSI